MTTTETTARGGEGRGSARGDDLGWLVARFADAVLQKLQADAEKYGYTDEWQRDDWADALREQVRRHVEKGDPRDVAAYCAFAWHHGWSLAVTDSGAGAPTDAEWETALTALEQARVRGGRSWDDEVIAARAAVLALRDRERGARAREAAVPGEWTCDQCGQRAPAGLFPAGLKHYCGGTWQSDAARRAAGGVGSAGSTQVAPWTSAQCARVDGVCALPLECWRQQRCDYTPDTGAGARGRGDA